jgi:transposase
MSSHYITDAAKSQVREMSLAGFSLRQIQAAVGVSRPTVITILRGTHKTHSASPEIRRKHDERDQRDWLRKFRAEVDLRRAEFERAWNDREPWIERFVKSWNPPEGVLE